MEQKTCPVTGPRSKTCCKEIHFDNMCGSQSRHTRWWYIQGSKMRKKMTCLLSQHMRMMEFAQRTEEDARLKINQRLATFKLETGCSTVWKYLMCWMSEESWVDLGKRHYVRELSCVNGLKSASVSLKSHKMMFQMYWKEPHVWNTVARYWKG